jgi:large subunit ribosomal protein L10
MSDENTKISANKQKKVAIVTELSEKFGKAKAVVFTNYQGITHKQLEGFKKAIKPLQAEYVVAKNSLLTRALEENKIKLSKEQTLDGQTGTLFLYDDVMSPLKALAKIIKELNLPSVKFGIMEKDFMTGEQVLKLSALPTKEVLLASLVAGLKSPIFGLHRALSWNLQKFVLALNAIAKAKPALAVAITASAPVVEAVSEPTPEPEKVKAKIEEQPKEETKSEDVKSEGGEN